MQLTIQIATVDKSGHRHTEKLLTIEKQTDSPNDIGLSLSESKLLLNTVQQSVIQEQAAEFLDEHRVCPCCQRNRRIKGKQKIQYRTLFGIIPVEGVRVYRCACEKNSPQTTFLSDGADNLRELQFNLYPESQHILDWFHITMRLTVLKQYAKGVSKNDPKLGTELLDSLTSTKWSI